MTRLAAIAVALGVLVAAGLGPAHAGKRVALVIGNADYQHAVRLANPANDANDIAARLSALGFEVILGVDQSEDEFADRLAEFASASERADVALFFYAGHGLQFEGANYLVPVEAKLETRFQVRQQTVTLASVIELMEEQASRVMVFLDACRDNPFADQLGRTLSRSGNAALLGRGLARVETRAPETLVTFAAAPGTVASDGQGRNSPFTAALLEHIGEPNTEVEVMLKRVTASVLAATDHQQRPERLSRLTSEFYFARTTPTAPPPASGGDSGGGNDLALARDVWNDIKSSDSEAVFESYVATFPGTVFAALARERLASLRAPFVPASCLDIRNHDPSGARDGEATLYVNGNADMPYSVWCADMAGEPAEYLTLGPGDGANQSVIVHGGAYDGEGGRDMVTRFSRVRLDPGALAIVSGDLRFAVSDGRIEQTCCENGGVPAGTRKPIAPAYGVARNCNAVDANPRLATTHVDLSRTAFRMASDMAWKAGGYFPRETPAASWSISADGRTAKATARSGYCAAIGPDGGKVRLSYAGKAASQAETNTFYINVR